MGSEFRFRDMLSRIVPWWLSDRDRVTEGTNVGFRYLWVVAASVDALLDRMIESTLAAWPGKGTYTALDRFIAPGRGMIRGIGETDEDFAARLLLWLDRSRELGSARSIVRAVHEYLEDRPTVVFVSRSKDDNGTFVPPNYTKIENGVVTTIQGTITNAWDWDSVSHPERAGNWWDFWLIIYKTTPAPQWPVRVGTFGTDWQFGGDTLGIGHGCTREEVDAVRWLISYHKSASAYCRSIIWIDDPANFDIVTGTGLPNGNWGAWGTTGSGARVRSDRNPGFRYWEGDQQ